MIWVANRHLRTVKTRQLNVSCGHYIFNLIQSINAYDKYRPITYCTGQNNDQERSPKL